MYYIFNNEKLRQNVLLLQRIVQTHRCKLWNQTGRQKKSSFYRDNFSLHSIVRIWTSIESIYNLEYFPSISLCRQGKKMPLNSQNFKQARCTSFHLIFFSLSVLCPSQVTVIDPLPYINYLKRIRKHQCIHEDPLLDKQASKGKCICLNI